METLTVGDIVIVKDSDDFLFKKDDVGNIGTILEYNPSYNYPYYIDFVYFKQYYKFSEIEKISDHL